MFLDLLSKIGLLQHDPATHILLKLPLGPKADVLTTIFAELLDNKANTPALIPSHAHLNFFYELVGSAFSLPLTHGKLTQRAIEIYTSWFEDEKVRPPPVADDFNHFLTTIIKHMTQFFINTPTSNLDEEYSRNAISVQILTFIRRIYTTHHTSFTPVVNEVLVKAMIGICKKYYEHALLPKNSAYFFSELELALFILHETWMMTQVSDMGLWEVIWKSYSNWTDQIETITQWYALQQTLNDTVLQNLGKETTVVPFTLQWLPLHLDHVLSPFTFDINISFVNYSFLRFSRFIGNCLKKSNDISLSATHALQLLIESFYGLPTTVCDGNIVLKMYGEFLFQTMVINCQFYHQTVILAASTILKFFLWNANTTTFSRENLANLYAGIISILDTPNPVAPTVLAFPLILDINFPGIEMLFPHYLRYIHQVVFKTPLDTVMRANIYQIVNKLVPRIRFFRTNPIPVVTNVIFESFENLQDCLSQVIAQSLEVETDTQLIIDLFQICRLFIDEFNHEPFLKEVCRIFADRVSTWVTETTLDFSPLLETSLTSLCIALAAHATPALLLEEVKTIITAYLALFADESPIRTYTSFFVEMNNLVVYLFGLLRAVPEELFHPLCNVLDIANGLADDKNPSLSGNIDRLNALLQTFVANTTLYSNLPVSERDVFASNPTLLEKHALFLVTPDALVTFVDLAAHYNDPALPILAIVRTDTCHHAATIRYSEHTPHPLVPAHAAVTALPNARLLATSKRFNFMNDTAIGYYLNNEYSGGVAKLLDKIKARQATPAPHNPTPSSSFDPEHSTFGFPLCVYNVTKFVSCLNISAVASPIHFVPFTPQLVTETIAALDKTATRAQYAVAVLHVGDGKLLGETKEFNWLVQRLGYLVDLKLAGTHLFAQKIARHADVVPQLPVVSSMTEEVVYCPNTMIPESVQGDFWELCDAVILFGVNEGNTQEWSVSTFTQGKPWLAVDPLSDGRFAVFNEEFVGSDYVVVSGDGLVSFLAESLLHALHLSPSTYANKDSRKDLIRGIYNNGTTLSETDILFRQVPSSQAAHDPIQDRPSLYGGVNSMNSTAAPMCLNGLNPRP